MMATKKVERAKKVRPGKAESSNPAGYAVLEKMVADRKKRDAQQGEPRKNQPGEVVGKSVSELLGPFIARHNVDPSVVERPDEFDHEAYAKEVEAEARRMRSERWVKICPAQFHRTFDASLSPAPAESVAVVLAWEPNPRGLWVIGETGRSKSWAVWTMLERVYVERRKSLLTLDGIQFANEAASVWGNSSNAEAWLQKLVEPAVLFIDDFGKRFTPAAQEAAFAVIDRRTSRKRPVLITTNYTGDRLAERMKDPDLSDPLRRRLRENCEVVVF